jgi:2-polyprenyl-6-methoxyphenol hydroxylase-like FAD-dependent oxidoreductase
VNAERGALLHAIHERLVPGTIQYGNAITGISNLADDGADLIVAADGIRSVVRPDVATNSRLGRPWTVWQAVLPDGADLLEPGTGVGTVGSTRFVGIFRHPGGELCWFLEEPGLDIGTPAAAVLARTATDEDRLVAEVARRTPPDRFVEWVARDRWPSRRAVAGNIVAIGDAAHPMLPCIGQGACTSIEDGVALAVALRQQPLDMALTRYRRLRLTKVRARVATAHLACAIRKPSPIATAVAATPLGVPFAHQSALSMRLLNRVDRRLLDTPLTGTSAGR